MPTCAVFGCTSGNRQNKNVSMHSFPKEKNILKIWKIRTKRLDTFDVKTARICCKHFREDDYKRDMRHELMKCKKKYKLKIGAVPTLCLPGSCSKRKLQHYISKSIFSQVFTNSYKIR